MRRLSTKEKVSVERCTLDALKENISDFQRRNASPKRIVIEQIKNVLDVASSDRVFEEAHGVTEEEEEEEEEEVEEEEEEEEEKEEEEDEDDVDDNDDDESRRESLTLRTKSTTTMHRYALTSPQPQR
uniref:Uncharacterized protein n=1 Tax=Vespula pensylvanica TaxID=30213 RepID=A0A834KFY3_VESPE|nr:hypothetical protein H0235_014793 [Vespula pensylvanica]